MGDIMRLISFENMVNWIFSEYEARGRVFGIQKEKFYVNKSNTSCEIFGEKISSVLGPAAGPNSQLAQNIVASYLAGARVIELKTVQKMDGEELRACVPKPCINATDECYNTEWSTELTVEEALDEYIKAHFLISVFAKELGLANEKDFIFNMSVGYDYEGITLPKIDNYIETMKDCKNSPIYKEIMEVLTKNLSKFKNVDESFVKNITTKVSNSITLSTLHGCLPSEIFKISNYLITEKNIHTYIKCNPTLLGYEYARKVLDDAGYTYIAFDDHHFKADLQYADALKMIKDLQEIANGKNLQFGVKITNTFPVQIKNDELSGEEMYMSGRSLYLLSLSVAKKLTDDFNGTLSISYSGGADFYNVKDLALAGIKPITVATTILKPGGYEKFQQLSTDVENSFGSTKVSVEGLDKLFNSMTSDFYYNKDFRPVNNRKTDSSLPLFNCFKSPCSDGGCPINQQITEYLKLVAAGEYQKALDVILIDNPLPSITGTICDHNCQKKCTRLDIDEAIKIRRAKKIAADHAQDDHNNDYILKPLKTDKKVCIIGAGPAGIAAGVFLRRNGVLVDVYEKADKPFGIVSRVIPEFRITKHTIERDYKYAKEVGVNFIFNTEVKDINEMKAKYDFVFVATGSWDNGINPFENENSNVLNALEFLQTCKEKDFKFDIGANVAVIGGGDVAMDCARAAKRVKGVQDVTVLYRRTRDQIRAEKEELLECEEDAVKFEYLVAPKTYDGKTITLDKMTLSERDDSGRRSVNKTGETVERQFDTVVIATGSNVNTEIFTQNGIALDKWNSPVINAHNESSVSNVYIIGDCRKGASTVVKGIADAKAAVKDVLAKLGLSHDFVKVSTVTNESDLYAKKGVSALAKDDNTDASRCLECNYVCEVCADVCPNRANVVLDYHTVLHIDGMCNECGNCKMFCPHKDAPYKDKPTLFWSKEDFEDSTNRGFVEIAENKYLVRLEGGEVVEYTVGDNFDPNFKELIDQVRNKYSFYKG